MKRPSPVQHLTTPTLLLRPFRRRDVAPLLEAVAESLPDLLPWLPWARPGYDRADSVAFIRESIAAWRDGRAYDFTIRPRVEPVRHLGNVSIWATDRSRLVGEIGYWVRSSETGKGIATQATARIAELAFTEMGMHRVTLRIAVGNRASERVAEKLGFAREGLLRQELRVGGVWMDHTAWGLLKSEFEGNRPGYQAAGILAG